MCAASPCTGVYALNTSAVKKEKHNRETNSLTDKLEMLHCPTSHFTVSRDRRSTIQMRWKEFFSTAHKLLLSVSPSVVWP